MKTILFVLLLLGTSALNSQLFADCCAEDPAFISCMKGCQGKPESCEAKCASFSGCDANCAKSELWT